jgi:hypothetical protein
MPVLAIDSCLILACQIPEIPLDIFEKSFLLLKQCSIYKASMICEWKNRRAYLRDFFQIDKSKSILRGTIPLAMGILIT